MEKTMVSLQAFLSFIHRARNARPPPSHFSLFTPAMQATVSTKTFNTGLLALDKNIQAFFFIF